MNDHTVRILNRHPTKRVLWLEPWGEDYWMAPDDEFEIIARNVNERFYFVIESADELTCWAGGSVLEVNVVCNGTKLECGHNRPTDDQ